MVTAIWITTIISVLGAIELLARAAVAEASIVMARVNETR